MEQHTVQTYQLTMNVNNIQDISDHRTITLYPHDVYACITYNRWKYMTETSCTIHVFIAENTVICHCLAVTSCYPQMYGLKVFKEILFIYLSASCLQFQCHDIFEVFPGTQQCSHKVRENLLKFSRFELNIYGQLNCLYFY